jgi:hypothetical protein
MMGSMRAARGRDQEEHEQESESEEAHEAPTRGGPQFTSRGAIPPIGSLAPVAMGPSASDRAFGGAPSHDLLPHEATHVVQQRQGRVKATEDEGLEHEADEVGKRAGR